MRPPVNWWVVAGKALHLVLVVLTAWALVLLVVVALAAAVGGWP